MFVPSLLKSRIHIKVEMFLGKTWYNWTISALIVFIQLFLNRCFQYEITQCSWLQHLNTYITFIFTMHITAYFSATRCSFNEPDGDENKVLDIQFLVRKSK